LSPELFPRKQSAPEFDFTRSAAIGSLVFHLLLITGLAVMPASDAPSHQPPAHVLRKTIIYDPPTQLTQKAPNKKPTSKELTVEAVAPRPVVKAPAPAPQTRKTMALPPVEVTKEAPRPPPVIQAPPEAPKIDVARNAPLPELKPQVAPPPQETPKLAFQTPGPQSNPTGKVNPNFAAPPSVDQAVRNLARGEGAGGQAVGDSVADLSGAGPGLNLPPSAGRPRSALELVSDPMGVDFKPYLIQILATVRRNWFAIYPESARLGTRGRVVLEFAISKDGKILKVVYSAQSGARPLDEAAVAALSASNPLPPLPVEFKGQRVVLRFTFSYNIPVR
jgi:TonB family protein